MKLITIIRDRLLISIFVLNQLLLVVFIAFILVGCSSKYELPGVEQLSKDLVHSMQKTTVDDSTGKRKLSNIYKLLRCEELYSVKQQKGSYLIQFKGGIELLDTIYNYGNYGYKTKYRSSKMGLLSYKGKIEKGTVVSFTGKAEYALTNNGWQFKQYSVRLVNALAPSF